MAVWEKWLHDLSSQNKIIFRNGTKFWCAFDHVHWYLLFKTFYLEETSSTYRYHTNFKFSSTMSQWNECLYNYYVVKCLCLYSLTDNNVVTVLKERYCIILLLLHHFVGLHLSSKCERYWTYLDQQTKNSYFHNHQFPCNKISKFRKMENWATFLTLLQKGFLLS